LNAHPINGQYNFYKEELTNHKGYMLLDRGQPDLFFPSPNHVMKVRYVNANQQCILGDVDYDNLNNKVTFDIPSESLQHGTVYRVSIIKIPASGNGQVVDPCAITPPPPPPPPTQSAVSPNDDTPATNNPPSNTPPPVVSIANIAFRVSNYMTFRDKISAWFGSDVPNGEFGYKGTIEPFDKFELGSGGSPALINMSATMTGGWFGEEEIQFMWNQLPADDYGINIGRSVNPFGYPPNKASRFIQTPANANISISTGNIATPPGDFSGVSQIFQFNVPQIVKEDFSSFRSDINYLMTQGTFEIADYIQDAGGSTEGLTLHQMWQQYPDEFGNLAPLKYFQFYFNYPNLENPNNGSQFKVTFTYRPPGHGNNTSIKEISIWKNP
jgi:hypothetical protein